MDLTSTFYKEVLPGVYATTVQGIEPEKPVSVLIVGIYREPGAEQIVNFLVKQAVRIETIAYQENEHSLLEKLLEVSRDALFVGVSLMTNFFERAKQISLFCFKKYI